MINIIWAQEAKNQYFKILGYLFDEWGERVAEDFEERILKIENQIASGIVKFAFSQNLGYEKCVIDKHNSLIFKRKENHIEIIALVDNRSNHPY